ncbi:MAG: class I SAM-dependent methyltransferase [Parvularculaceae bacterium]
MIKRLLIASSAFALLACGGENAGEPEARDAAAAEAGDAAEADAAAAAEETADAAPATNAALDAALAAQPDEAKARYGARHPKETLEFFGVEPGMTVVEVLPGGGWYSKILIPYLGDDGTLVGADYAVDMWRLFGGRFSTEEAIAAKQTWTTDWPAQAAEWGEGADVKAFQFESLPADMEGAADVILFVRAMHHLNRFQEEGGHLEAALADAYAVLKPGGVVGVVQHRGPEENDDKWAEGDNGYLKQSQVVAAVEGAGFEFVEASEINANPKDQPTNEDVVWRLPPALGTSGDDEEKKAEMTAIGESDRMTLMFRKPA